MDLGGFLSKHLTALEGDQARHNLMLGLLRFAQNGQRGLRHWSLGEGAACAVQTPPHFLVLGDLGEAECDALADEVRDSEFKGCVGADDTPARMQRSLAKHGILLERAMPQRIYLLDQRPIYPGATGSGRRAEEEDLELFVDWFYRFYREASPKERPAERPEVEAIFRERPVFIWEEGGRPMAMAARNRETRDGSVISLVYTPPEFRGRGFAGSATSFACEHALDAGKKMCFLYTDLRNPISNRVYQKIGFRPWCDAANFVRK